jgi:RIO-like serine/threonine protein kinase
VLLKLKLKMSKEHLILLTRKERVNNQFAVVPEELIASTFCLMLQQT